ncbi:MAG: sigma-70 family RNA polymerase sigma factor [Acidobacteria bacterium]|nr:sigma-70 family RNA polymerase sigma factor [Acidobacteriota bacterium]MCW5969883.1 sigma-70 family RNA polymerase sigma factor [Blastocatellales bacterium]
MPSSAEITGLLIAWREGDQAALERLTPLLYRDLHRLAHRYMRGENRGHTLQTSALVNEAFVRLIENPRIDWQGRAHFFGLAAHIMRNILLDHARGRGRAKRGGGAYHFSLDEAAIVSESRAAELIALDDALKDLASLDPRKSRLVELRFFGGLSNEEISEVMGLSLRTVEREWQKAKTWLHHAISKSDLDEA